MADLTKHGTVKTWNTSTYEHATSGLLQKRAELYQEAERIRDRLAEIKNDISALDRVLSTLGYEGDLDAQMPRQKREVLFGRGELQRAILDALRGFDEPVTARTIARDIIALKGDDPRDRKYLSEVVKRVSKCLRKMKADGLVTSAPGQGGALVYGVWR